MEFSPELIDKNSTQYKELAKKVEEQLKKVFEGDDSRINVKVVQFR